MESKEGNSAQPGGNKRAEMMAAMELAGAKALDGDDLVKWVALTDKVLERPESLSAISSAAGAASTPVIPQKAKEIALWGLGGVLAYNFVIRDLLILLLKLENAPPPAITLDAVMRLFAL